MKIAQTLSGGTQKDTAPELMAQGDAYYYSHGASAAPFPVYRIILSNEQRTRYYLDPVSGIPLESLDSNARRYRWLHQGLHAMDFSPVLRARPVWDLLMLSLLSGVTVVCITGAYLGLRRCFRKIPADVLDPACICEACAFDRVNAKMVTSCDPVFRHRS
jgi:hypothetical protein